MFWGKHKLKFFLKFTQASIDEKEERKKKTTKSYYKFKCSSFRFGINSKKYKYCYTVTTKFWILYPQQFKYFKYSFIKNNNNNNKSLSFSFQKYILEFNTYIILQPWTRSMNRDSKDSNLSLNIMNSDMHRFMCRFIYLLT